MPLMAQSLGSLIADAMQNNPEILAAQKRYEASRQRPLLSRDGRCRAAS